MLGDNGSVDRLATGILDLDELLKGGVEERSITEFYSPSLGVMRLLYHRLILSFVELGIVLIHAQDFTGLDPYLLRVMARRLGIDWSLVESKVRLARGFKLEDVMVLLDSAEDLGVPVVMIFDPFLHGNHAGLSWKIRDLIRSSTVLSINRGRVYPRGGRYHSHTAHALVRMHPLEDAVRAELVKHPSLPYARAYIPIRELMGEWGGRRPLLEWL